MPIKKGSKFESGYATVSDDDGVNYRVISSLMTDMGFTMNHSTARAYILRVMKKFAESLSEQWDIEIDSDRYDEISKSPQFQQGIGEILHLINREMNYFSKKGDDLNV